MKKTGRKRPWYEYLWIVTPIYLGLGFFNILFAWLGMIFFCLPLIIALAGGGKLYCNPGGGKRSGWQVGSHWLAEGSSIATATVTGAGSLPCWGASWACPAAVPPHGGWEAAGSAMDF